MMPKVQGYWNKFCVLTTVCALVIAIEAEAQDSPEILFSQGNEAYSREDYAQAIEFYQRAANLGESSALHYNLGNAYFRVDDVGRAVLHYEKALALDPANPDAIRNLAFIRESAELSEPEYGILTKFGEKLPLNIWCWMAAVTFWGVAALTLLPRLYGGGTLATRLLLSVCLLTLLTALVALSGYHVKSKEAVILQADTPLRVAPSPQSNEYGFLQAGEIATVEKTHQNYFFLHTTSGKTGWVLVEEIGKVWE